ncbi:MAG: MBL fold metallo-hydrolase [Verrucomicrobiota bacterium]
MELGHFTGGQLATNAYWLRAREGEGVILFDAPQETLSVLAERGVEHVAALVLTHGHFDHMWEAAAVQQKYGCTVYIHPADEVMITDPKCFLPWIGMEMATVPEHELIELPPEGAGDFSVAGRTFRAFHIPGHSPGSVAFYDAGQKVAIVGDTLFAGGIGRTDLPGGSQEQLIRGIQRHLLSLPPETRVHAGHMGPTSIGEEAATNFYLTA